MKYTSTREDKELLNFKQVTLKGLASDGGLYVPKNWKQPNLNFPIRILLLKNCL